MYVRRENLDKIFAYMNSINKKYDYIGIFNQGVAIVVKNNLYGAILVGGYEIISPAYDYISAFKDGYAHAIRKGECKILDLSGRECKKYNEKLIAIPSKYDSVREFKDGYACVLLDGKWGAIDTECNEIFEPQFYFLSDFVSGTAIYRKEPSQTENSWGWITASGYCSDCNYPKPVIEPDGNLIIERNEMSTRTNVGVFVKAQTRKVRINNNGQILVLNGDSEVALPKDYLVANNFANGLAVVQDSTGYWGAVNISGKLVIPLQYKLMHNFCENKTFAINKNSKLCLIAANGTIIRIFDTYTDAQSFKNGYAIVYENTKEGIIDGNGKELLAPLRGHIFQTNISNEFEITSLECKRGWFNALTRFFIKPRYNKIIEVKKDCVKVEVDEIGEVLIDLSGNVFVDKDDKRITFPDWCIGVKKINDNIFLGITDNGRWGLLDDSGDTLCKPTFDNIGEVDNDIIPLIKTETITVGGWRKETKEITKYGLYNINSKVSIPVEYDVCPEYSNGYYKITSKGLLGIINGMGAIVLKPEWKQIHLSNGYYIVSKIVKEGYSEIERFGLITLSGNVILETKYKAISVLREGLYKVKENNSWSIFNDEGRLTNETYDEIDIEGDYIIVSKNGLSGRLNEHAEKVIRSDNGDYLILPLKFAWGHDFENGIAKVLINGCDNFIDKTFNIVINSENKIIPIDKSIDYLVSKDKKGNYIFVQDDKYGIIGHSGKIIIEAKYQSLSHLTDDLYIAGIIKEGDHYNTYGVIDIDDKTILTFEYSSIKPYGGKIPRSYWSWDDEYITEQVEIPEEVQHWLVHKNGYGLIDRSGKICIPSEYNDIQKFENGFFVKNNDKYGVIDSNYTIICEPKYSTVKLIGNGLWKVSIITSQSYNNKTEVFGILDSFGKERLEPIYQFIGDVNDNRVTEGRAIINLKGQLGLVDENYCILAEPQYKHISEFKNGKATVTKCVFKQNMPGGDIVHGEIDRNGVFTDISEIAENDVHSISNANATNSNVKIIKTLRNGYVVIQKDDPSSIYQYCAIIDKDNNIILPYKYHRIEELEGGMYLAEYSGNYGVLDSEFKEVIAPKYTNIRLIQDMLIASITSISTPSYELRRIFGLIDLKGSIVLPFEYSAIESASPGLVWIYSPQQNHRIIGLASLEGNILVEPKFDRVGDFVNGLSIVECGHWYYDEDDRSYNFVSENSGVIDTNGNEIIPLAYQSIKFDDTENCFVAQLKDRCLVTKINCKGEKIIKDLSGKTIVASDKFSYQSDYDENGISQVIYEGKKGKVNIENHLVIDFIVHKGIRQIILPTEYDWGYDSNSEYIVVEKGDKKGIIKHDLTLILNCVFDKIDVISCNDTTVFLCAIKKIEYSWQMFNIEGQSISEQYVEIKPIGYNLFARKINNKYQICDSNGHVTVEDLLDDVWDFGVCSVEYTYNSWGYNRNSKEDICYAIVRSNAKFGVLHQFGFLAIPIKYNTVEIINNNHFKVDGEDVDSEGNKLKDKYYSEKLISNEFEYVGKTRYGGVTIIKKDNLYGVVNMKGSIIVPIKYSSLKSYDDLLIATIYDESKQKQIQGVVNFLNEQIVPFDEQIIELEYFGNIEDYLIIGHCSGLCRVYTANGKKICELNITKIEPITNYIFKVIKEYDYDWSVCGVIDINGNEILPFTNGNKDFEFVERGLIKYSDYHSYGFMDAMGNILLRPIYEEIGNFVNGYAIVAKDSGEYFDEFESRYKRKICYGVIDSNIKEIIPCVYSQIEYDESINLFKVSYDGYKTKSGCLIMDYNGKKVLIDRKYHFCKDFHNERAIAIAGVYGSFKYALINVKSEEILPPIFDRLVMLKNGLYKFKINGKYGLVDANGNIIVPNIYTAIGDYNNNIAIVCSDSLYGIIDENGNELLPARYGFLGRLINNHRIVMINDVWGVYSLETKTTKIIKDVDYLGPVKDGICAMNIGGKYQKKNKQVDGGLWGYVTMDGDIVIIPQYEDARSFSEDMAAVKQNSKWGFIDKKGNVVVDFEYDGVESNFKNGRGALIKNDRYGDNIFVFNKYGELIESYNNQDDDFDDIYYDEAPSYNKYGGYNGYDDDTIDSAFEGDPYATWNID